MPLNLHLPHHHPSVHEDQSHEADPVVVVLSEPGFVQGCWLLLLRQLLQINKDFVIKIPVEP